MCQPDGTSNVGNPSSLYVMMLLKPLILLIKIIPIPYLQYLFLDETGYNKYLQNTSLVSHFDRSDKN